MTGVRRALVGCLAATLALGAVLSFGILHLPLGVVELVEGQAADPTAVVQQFGDAINRGDAAGAAALFSDTGTFKGIAVCQNTCTDRSDIQTAFANYWLPNVPGRVTIEQVCGDTVAVLSQSSNGAPAPVGSDRWGITTFRISDGRISAFERLPPPSLTLGDARAAAAQACHVVSPASPAPFNRGGVLSVDTRLTLWLGAMLLGVVATAVLALLLHIGRRLRTRA